MSNVRLVSQSKSCQTFRFYRFYRSFAFYGSFRLERLVAIVRLVRTFNPFCLDVNIKRELFYNMTPATLHLTFRKLIKLVNYSIWTQESAKAVPKLYKRPMSSHRRRFPGTLHAAKNWLKVNKTIICFQVSIISSVC